MQIIERGGVLYANINASDFADMPTGQKLATELGTQLKKVLPREIYLGDHNLNGSAVFRFIKLPSDPLKRMSRVQQIAQTGTDRTSPFSFANLSADIFSLTGRFNALIRPNNFLYGMRSKSLFAHPLEGHSGHFDANGFLVYDATTPTGLKNCSGDQDYPQIFTFRQPERKFLALLAIVGIENLDSNRVKPLSDLPYNHPLLVSIRNGR